MSILPTDRPVMEVTIKTGLRTRIFRLVPSLVQRWEYEVQNGDTGEVYENGDQRIIAVALQVLERQIIYAIGEYLGEQER